MLCLVLFLPFVLAFPQLLTHAPLRHADMVAVVSDSPADTGVCVPRTTLACAATDVRLDKLFRDWLLLHHAIKMPAPHSYAALSNADVRSAASLQLVRATIDFWICIVTCDREDTGGGVISL